MLKRFFFVSLVLVAVYVFFVMQQIHKADLQPQVAPSPEATPSEETENIRIRNFSFTKFSTEGFREMEIQGQSAWMQEEKVFLENVISKVYQEDIPITVTADEGEFEKESSLVYLRKNVVATTEDGARLLTNVLEIRTKEKIIQTDEPAEIIKDKMHLNGVGARCEQSLKVARFYKDIRVVFDEKSENGEENQIVITADGPLEINYDKNTARFENHVVSKDSQGSMESDRMDVFYDAMSKQVEKIYATGNVVVNQNDNKTYSDSVLYLVPDGRIILDGDPEAFGIPVTIEN